jgi:xanthine dehydrogenase small subunit
MQSPTSDTIRFVLNGEDIRLSDLSPRLTLLDWLRLDRRLTGSKEGCAEGDCGACTVLVGRLRAGHLVYESVNACIRLVASLHATHVVTIEHLAGRDGVLHPVQRAMVDHHASQCGFCTPGFVMSLYGLWLSEDDPDRAGIERALQGNLCRCTGYEPIIEAAEAVAKTRPDAVFDPIEKTRADINARLIALADGRNVHVKSTEGEAFVPATTADLAEFIAAHPHATIVAGSTDVGLWVTKQFREITPVVFINHLASLQTIRVEEGGVTIGAGVTYAEALPILEQTHPAIGRVMVRIGGGQVRNMGTIGGNIANGSPIGDMPPALIALGATLALRSREGSRTIPLEDFFIDYGKQDRQRHEFVESVFLPALKPDDVLAVYKISKRRDEDISALCGAFHIRRDGDGIVTHAQIAFGGMAGTPKRAAHCEAALLGRAMNVETAVHARLALARDYTPLSDWRASADYRLLAAQNLVSRLQLEMSGQAAELERHARGERA